MGLDDEIPAAYVEMSAKVLAELLDPDVSGTARDLDVVAELQHGERVWLAMPSNEDEWKTVSSSSSTGTRLRHYHSNMVDGKYSTCGAL